MPLGLNRTDLNKTGTSYRNGTPIDLSTHKFGNVIDWSPSPAHFGNPIPSDGNNQNVVDWSPDPAHFGNIVGGGGGTTNGFELEDGSGVILLEDGSILLQEV